jgi:putrescine transport system permease protein
MNAGPAPPEAAGASSLKRRFDRGVKSLTQGWLGRAAVIALPYAWLLLFLLLPF